MQTTACIHHHKQRANSFSRGWREIKAGMKEERATTRLRLLDFSLWIREALK